MNIVLKHFFFCLTILFYGINTNKVNAQSKSIKVVLFAGQSNMAGRGIYQNLDTETKARINKISNRVSLVNGKNKFPLSFTKGNKHTKDFGPELFVGLNLAEKFPEQEFIFIKTAVGGTSLHGAWSPNWTKEKALASERGEARQKMKLYNKHINSIQTELTNLKKQGKKYDIIGMFWMQGEKDTRLKLSATNYETNLEHLINSYRKEFKKPKMPFIFGQINCVKRGKKEYQTGINEVRAAMTNINKNVKYTQMIPTSLDPSWSDYPKHKDNTHYNAEGQKRLGNAMFKAFETFYIF